MLGRLYIDKDIEVCVISPGGVGTTFLIEFLSKYKTLNHPYDFDDIKHLPIPPLSKNKRLKIIFIYGDPIESTISLFSRNFQYLQLSKLNRFRIKKPFFSSDIDIDVFARKQSEDFNFLAQFNNYYSKFRFWPTLFVRYESIHEHVDDILDFLDIQEEAKEHFPVYKKRNSEKDSLSSQTLNDLRIIYSDLYKVIETLPKPVSISSKKQHVLTAFLYKEYWIALLLELKRYLFNGKQ